MTRDELSALFRNPDSVLQRAGFWKTPRELADIGDCFVVRNGGHEEAKQVLDNYLEQIDLAAVGTSSAKGQVIAFLGIQDID